MEWFAGILFAAAVVYCSAVAIYPAVMQRRHDADLAAREAAGTADPFERAVVWK
jgi:hypothetical protein